MAHTPERHFASGSARTINFPPTPALTPSNSNLTSETAQTILDYVPPAEAFISRGAYVLCNHLILEGMVPYLSYAADIMTLLHTCHAMRKFLRWYLSPKLNMLSFADSPRADGVSLYGFLSINSVEQRGRWEVLTHLDVSNTQIDTATALEIVYSTFTPKVQRILEPWAMNRHKAELSQLTMFRLQNCRSVNANTVSQYLQSVFSSIMKDYWARSSFSANDLLAALRIKTVFRFFVFNGPPPKDVKTLNKSGLVGCTSLRSLYMANCESLYVDKRWAGRERWSYETTCPFNKIVAQWMTIAGCLGIDVELNFCDGYCDSMNAFLCDGASMDEGDKYGRSMFQQALANAQVDEVFELSNVPDFPFAEPPAPIPRMPYERVIHHPASDRVFHFPGSPDDRPRLRPDFDFSTYLFSQSTIQLLLKNFSRYPLPQQSYVLWSLINFSASIPPIPTALPSDKDKLTALNRTLLQNLLLQWNSSRLTSIVNSHIQPFNIPLRSPESQILIYHPRSTTANLTILIRQLLTYPLPRRLVSPGMLYATPPRMDDLRKVAMTEYPRGACQVCNREVWLCEMCNRELRVYCAECMIGKMENHQSFDKRLGKEGVWRDWGEKEKRGGVEGEQQQQQQTNEFPI